MAKTNTLKLAVRRFGPFEQALEKIWAAFCEKTGCQLELDARPMDLHPLYDAILAKEGLKNGEWDMALFHTDWVAEAYTTNAIEDLRPYISHNPPADFPDGWSQSLLGTQEVGDKILGLPFHDGPECLIYRKDLFEDATEKANFKKRYGRELEPPKTWAEFLEIAHFFQRPEDNLYGTVIAAYPDGHNTVYDFCLQVWTHGGELTDQNGRINVNTPAAIEGLRFYKHLLHDKTAIHPKSAEMDSVASGMAFSRGEIALMVNWFGFASMCEVDPDSSVKGKVDITSIPAGPAGSTVSLNCYWLYVIGTGSRHKEIAYDFARFAVSAGNDKLLTLEGATGCRKSSWADPEINASIPYYYRLEAIHEDARTLPRKSHWAKIAGVIDKIVLDVLNTDKTVEQILSEYQQEIDLIENKHTDGNIL